MIPRVHTEPVSSLFESSRRTRTGLLLATGRWLFFLEVPRTSSVVKSRSFAFAAKPKCHPPSCSQTPPARTTHYSLYPGPLSSSQPPTSSIQSTRPLHLHATHGIRLSTCITCMQRTPLCNMQHATCIMHCMQFFIHDTCTKQSPVGSTHSTAAPLTALYCLLSSHSTHRTHSITK